MAAITVRNLSDETHRALKARAARHGRSTEAEIRAILDESVSSSDRVKLGSLLVDIAWTAGTVDLVLERDRSPHEPVDLA